MNPLFSADPVERVLAMIAVRPRIPVPQWPRRAAWDCPVRMTAAELEKLPTVHERHISSALHHDVFAVRDGGVTWAIGRVVWRSVELPPSRPRRWSDMPEGARAKVVFRPVKVAPTLADLERELGPRADARRLRAQATTIGGVAA